MSAILKIYQSILIKFPICSQAVQTGLLMGSGDLIAQALLEKRSLLEIDLGRTARFSFIGTCFVGPPLRIWYGFMDKRIGNKGKMATLKKVTFDQLLFAPPFLAIIMALVDLAKGSTLNETQERLRHDYPDVLKTNYKFWPAIQLCNFYIIPLQYQVVTVQLVAIFWNTYLSWKMNQAIPNNFSSSTKFDSEFQVLLFIEIEGAIMPLFCLHALFAGCSFPSNLLSET